jgi:uncharacterized protein YndB with AHSA1/START domain
MNSLNDHETTADREIVSSRIFRIGRDLMFTAWSDPHLLARWWGPKGFTNTFHEFDFRQGGDWKFIMHGPEGGNYSNHSRFIEIIVPERIVLDHISNPQFRVIASFDHHHEDTLLTFRMIFNTAQERDKVSKYAVDANEQNFDRLEALLNETYPETGTRG